MCVYVLVCCNLDALSDYDAADNEDADKCADMVLKLQLQLKVLQMISSARADALTHAHNLTMCQLTK